MTRLRIALAGGLPLVVVATGACTDVGSEPVPEERTPDRMEVDVAEDLIMEGAETEASVRLLDTEGRPFERLPPWLRLESTDGEVLAVRDGQRIRGEGPGRATVRARGDDLSEEREVRVNPAELDLSVASVIVNQAAQDMDGSVPLVAGRAGFLRVFLQGDQVNFFEPDVEARIYQDGEPLETLTLEPRGEGVPREPDEDAVERTWGAPLPADLVVPGMEVVVVADPEGTIPLDEESASARYPAEGRASLDVRELADFKMTLVPVEQPDGEGGTVASALDEGNVDDYVEAFLRMFPVAEDPDIELREPFRVSQAAESGPSWVEGLQELRMMQLSEAPERYHYGVLQRTTGNITGIGYVGLAAGMGHDDLSAGAHRTLAHELGHNMGLLHAPCGLPAGDSSLDPNFPNEDGAIGSAGIDARDQVLHPSTSPDIMGYCRPAWIGPHMYGSALEFRDREEPLDSDTGDVLEQGTSSASSAEGGPGALLVSGTVSDGEVRLFPALQVDAPSALPDGEGELRLEGIDDGGGTLFDLSFDPTPLADAGPDAYGFAFVLPAELARPGELARLEVRGAAGAAHQASTVPGAERPGDVEAMQAEPGPDAEPPAGLHASRVEDGIRIQWDDAERPFVAVRDADGSTTLAYGRGGEVLVPGDHHELVVDLSHGTGSEAVRIPVD